ncbi:MAG: sugar ABC transporter permease [Thermoprotei archaeon]|nr:MAG: sugar ABC transporter permease [Thermoprotei archaeon]
MLAKDQYLAYLNKVLGVLKEVKTRFGRFILLTVFLTPLLTMMALAWISPVVLTIYLSFTDLNIQNLLTFNVRLTLENFGKIFKYDPFVPEVLRITVMYVTSVLFINAIYSLILSIVLAYLIRNEFLSIFLRVSWLIPRITPGIIYALMWNWFIDPRSGLLNPLLQALGVPAEWLPRSWLLQKPYSQLLMIIVNGYVGASFGMIVYTAAIKSVPDDIIHAAKVDGASDLQVARHIIIPLLKWPILFVTAWQTLSLMASYEQILMIWGSGGGGGYRGITRAAGVTVWALYSYTKAFDDFEYGYASALSLLLVIIGIALIILYFKIFGFRRLMEPSRVEV